MKKICIAFIALLLIIVFIPLIIVTIMSKTIDNNPHGSADMLEEYAENPSETAAGAEISLE